MACAIGTVQNFIIEYGEVEGEPENIRCVEGNGDSNIGGGLVSIKRPVGQVFSLVACGKPSQVAMVILP
jgi:hypothetical protein